MELTGKIIAVLELRGGVSQRTGNKWQSQEYVIEVPGQYPKHCAFTVFGEDRIKKLNIQMGEYLIVQFDIDAREYNGRWYNDFRAYNVIREQTILQPAQIEKTTSISDLPFAAPTSDMEDPLKKDDGSELPF